MTVPRNVRETSITLDYDEDVCYLDTNVKSVASKALRVGMKERTKDGATHRRFVGKATQVALRRGTRKGATARAGDDDRLAAARAKRGKKG
jgi:hypothetical protein